MDPHHRQNCFEIFGLDYMIDDNSKVWLIEVNTNPCLELSSPLLARIIPSMLENAFKIVMDPIFPPPVFYNPKKLLLDRLDNNKFELIFDEEEEGHILLQQREQQKEDLIGPIEEETGEEDNDE